MPRPLRSAAALTLTALAAALHPAQAATLQSSLKESIESAGQTAIQAIKGASPTTVSATSQTNDIALSADHVSYDTPTHTVTATGNVRVFSPRGAVWADTLIYNTQTKQMQAKGNVVFSDPNRTTLFVDNLELSGDLKTGILNAIKMRMGAGGPAMAAERAEKQDDIIILTNAVYSPCKTCVKLPAVSQTTGPSESITSENLSETASLTAATPVSETTLPWQIRAQKITYNDTKQTVSYKNAMLDLYGMPVAYLPYFSHPTGKTAQSGLLPPKFGRSTTRGEETTLSGYYRVSDTADGTLRARLMTSRGLQTQVETRFAGTNTTGEIRGSIINDRSTSSLRSDLDVSTAYVFEPGKRMGIDGQITSDDGYLTDYFNRTTPYLSQTVFGEDADPNHYYALTATHFQDLRTTTDPASTAQVLPHLTLERIFNPNPALGFGENDQFIMSADALSLYRSVGIRSRRMVMQGKYLHPFETQDGQRLTMATSLRGDIYQVENEPAAGGTIARSNGFQNRLLPEVSIDWEKPYMSPSGYHVITPRAMGVFSPRGSNPADIPNEDSVAYELDSSNLFDTNRFAGYDRVETGSRFIYGLDNTWGTPAHTDWRFFFGQSYRPYATTDLPAQGGAATKNSDWITRAEANPTKWLSLYSQNRLDNADWNVRRSDAGIMLGEGQEETHLRTSYSQLDGGAEELGLDGRYNITDEYSTYGQARKDLRQGGKTLTSEGGVSYTHNCYRLSLMARRRGFSNAAVPPSTDYLLNFELLTLGKDRD